jgi:hypothetical protein
MSETNQQPKNDLPASFRNWLETIAILLGLLMTVYGMINQSRNDTNSMRYLGVAGYVVILLAVVWLGWVNKKVHPVLRTAGLGLFAVLSPLFFIWVGMWIVKAPIDLNNHPIERDAYTIFDYSGQGESGGSGAGYVAVSNNFYLSQPVAKISFDYTLEKKESFTGFVIHFDPPLDITGYRSIRFAIKFKNDQARVKLSLRDSAKNAVGVVLGDGPFGNAGNSQEQTLIIALDNFQNVVRLLLQEIEFSADGSFVTGSNQVIISNVSFTK